MYALFARFRPTLLCICVFLQQHQQQQAPRERPGQGQRRTPATPPLPCTLPSTNATLCARASLRGCVYPAFSLATLRRRRACLSLSLAPRRRQPFRAAAAHCSRRCGAVRKSSSSKQHNLFTNLPPPQQQKRRPLQQCSARAHIIIIIIATTTYAHTHTHTHRAQEILVAGSPPPPYCPPLCRLPQRTHTPF